MPWSTACKISLYGQPSYGSLMRNPRKTLVAPPLNLCTLESVSVETSAVFACLTVALESRCSHLIDISVIKGKNEEGILYPSAQPSSFTTLFQRKNLGAIFSPKDWCQRYSIWWSVLRPPSPPWSYLQLFCLVEYSSPGAPRQPPTLLTIEFSSHPRSQNHISIACLNLKVCTKSKPQDTTSHPFGWLS